MSKFKISSARFVASLSVMAGAFVGLLRDAQCKATTAAIVELGAAGCAGQGV